MSELTREQIEEISEELTALPWPKLNCPDEAEMRDLGYAALPLLQKLSLYLLTPPHTGQVGKITPEWLERKLAEAPDEPSILGASNHDMTEDQRLDDPRHGQARGINRDNRGRT